MKRHLLLITFCLLGAAQFVQAQTYDSFMGSRLTDPLFRTGEEFAIIVKNYSSRNVRVNVYDDASFFPLNSSAKAGVINAAREGLAYKVFNGVALGIPRFPVRSEESVQKESDLLASRDIFENLSGANFNRDIKFVIDGPGNPVCKNVFPEYDMPNPGVKIPPYYLNIDENAPSANVIYITVAPEGTACLAEFKQYGDMSWLDGGPGPARPRPVIETIETPSTWDLLMFDSFGMIAPYAGVSSIGTGVYMALPVDDAIRNWGM